MGGFSNLGSVYVEVGADLSALTGALQGAVAEAAQAGQQIGTAIESGVSTGGGLQQLEQEVQSIGPQLTELGVGFSELGKGMVIAGAAATEMTAELVGIAEEAVGLTGKIQFATAALTTFFGSASKSRDVLEQLHTIEQSSIFSFPDLTSAAQKLAALGMSAEKIPDTLKAVAVAAEAVGGSTASLDSATTAIARIQSTGVLSQRALMQLGVSWDDLGKQMGVSAAEAKAQLSKGLTDANTIVDTLTATINAKFQGMAAALGETFPVALNRLKAAWDELLLKIGPSLGPMLADMMKGLSAAIAVISDIVSAFGKLPTPIQDVIIVFAALAAAAGPVTLALGAFIFAAGEIMESLPKISGALLAFRDAEVAVEAAQGGEAIAAVATSATAASGAFAGLATVAGVVGTALAGLAALGFGVLLGDWLGHLESVQHAFDAVTASVPGLESAILHLTGAFSGLKDAQDAEQFTITMMEQRLAALGITIDKTGLSVDQYAAKLRDAIKAQSDFNASIDDGGSHFSRGAQAIITSTQQLQVNLQKAKEVLAELTAAYKENGTGADMVTAAQKKVTEAMAALGDKSAAAAKEATKLAGEQAKVLVQFDDLIIKMPLTATAMEDAFKKGFNTQNAVDQIQKLIDKIRDMKDFAANPAFQVYVDMLLKMQQRIVTLSDATQAYNNQQAFQATQTQRVIDVTTVLDRAQQSLSDSMKNGVNVIGSTAKIFDLVTMSGDGTVQMIVGRASPAFVSLADSARAAGMSIQDFAAKTQEAALDAQAAMGNIGAASDSMVLKIKTGQDDAVKSLQAAIGAYSTLQDEVNSGTASQAELARAISAVKAAAAAANIDLANIGSTMALDADQQQKLNQALAAGASGFKALGAAAQAAGDAIGQLGRDMNNYFNAADTAFNDTSGMKNATGPSVQGGPGQVAVQHFGAGGNVGAGFDQTVTWVTPTVFSIGPDPAGGGQSKAASMPPPQAISLAGTGLDGLTKSTAALAAAAPATTESTTALKTELTNLAGEMQSGWDTVNKLGSAMDALSRQGLQATDSYKSMADQVNGIYTLNGKLNDQYQAIQAQLGTAVTGLSTFGSTVATVSTALTTVTNAAAGFIGLSSTLLGPNPAAGANLQPGALAGMVDLGPSRTFVSPPTGPSSPLAADLVNAMGQVRWSVTLDGKELAGSFVQFFQNNGLVVPRH